MKDLAIRLAFFMLLFVLVPFILICLFDDDKTDGEKIFVYDTAKSEVYEMDREEYIVLVVSAEMPCVFENEALKAQAVAARTYSLHKYNKKDEKHHGADMCTDYNHCQAFRNYDELKKIWGKDFEVNINKIKKAVESTKGQILKYENEPALTVFHSCSNGKTENSSDVWSGSIPYLISVESAGDFSMPNYESLLVLDKREFLNKLSPELISQYDMNKIQNIIGDISYTKGGNVEFLNVCNKEIKGTEVRRILSLKSSAFSVEESEKDIELKVYGNGHGVGMSQYGANSMAKQGNGYIEILYHYYPGTKLALTDDI